MTDPENRSRKQSQTTWITDGECESVGEVLDRRESDARRNRYGGATMMG